MPMKKGRVIRKNQDEISGILKDTDSGEDLVWIDKNARGKIKENDAVNYLPIVSFGDYVIGTDLVKDN